MDPLNHEDRLLDFAPSQHPQDPIAQDPQPLDDFRRRVREDIASEKEVKDRLFLQSFGEAVKQDPVLAGEAQRLSAQTGLDVGTISRNVDQVRQIVRLSRARMERAAGLSPILYRQLNDPEFAKLAFDDTDNLSFIGGVMDSWEVGQLTTERGFLGERVRSRMATDQDFARLAWVNERLKKLPSASPNVVAGLFKYLGQMEQTVPRALMAGTATGLGMAGMAGMVGQAGPQAFAAEEIFTVPGAFLGGLYAGSAATFAMQSLQIEAGNAFLDMRDMGISDVLASDLALGYGAVAAALETTGVGFATGAARKALAKDITKSIAESLVKPTVGKAAGNFALRYAEAAGGEIGTELMQEVSNVVAEEYGRDLMGKPLESGTAEGRKRIAGRLGDVIVETAKGMALLAAPGPLFAAHRDSVRIANARRDGEVIETLSKLFTDSEVRKRNPTAFESFLKASANGKPIENLHVDGAMFAQALRESGATGEQLMQQIPEVAKAAAAAAENGGDVVIPIGVYGARIAGTDFGNALKPHLRVSANAMSIAEADQAHQLAADNKEQLQAAVEQRIATDEEFAKSSQVVHETLRKQLLAVGVKDMSPADVEAATIPVRDFYAGLALQMGKTPEEVYALYPFKVESGAAPAMAFRQAEFYSALERGIEALPTKSATAAGWKEALKGLLNKGGVKAEEVEWSGLHAWLDQQQGKVSKEEVVGFLRENGVKVETVASSNPAAAKRLEELRAQQELVGREPDSPDRTSRFNALRDEIDRVKAEVEGEMLPKFQQYTLPGGTNYREVLLTLPDAPPKFEFTDPAPFAGSGEGRWEGREPVSGVQEVQINRDGERIGSMRYWPKRPGHMASDPTGRQRFLSEGPAWVVSTIRLQNAHFPTIEAAREHVLLHEGGADIEALKREYTRVYGEYRAVSDRIANEHGLGPAPEAAREELAAHLERERDARYALDRATEARDRLATGFRSSHWSQRNVLAHLRLNDRVDADGKRVLFVEEIQSDWAQKGRTRGFAEFQPRFEAYYRTEGAPNPVDVPVGYGPTAEAALADAREAGWSGISELQTREVAPVPPAPSMVKKGPFVTKTEGWLNLALKRVLQLAVDGGYDRVAFITGQQSAARYDLSQHIDKLTYWKNDDGSYGLGVFKDGAPLRLNEQDTGLDMTRIPAEKLPDIVGKEMAEKIARGEGNQYELDTRIRWFEGLDLQVGGQGMQAFYDRIVPNAVNALLKKLGGGKMEAVSLYRKEPITSYSITEADGEFEVADREGTPLRTFPTRDAAESYAREAQRLGADDRSPSDIHEQLGFDVTAALKAKVQAGLALFAGGSESPRGSYDPSRMTAILHQKADASTFLHEASHHFLHVTMQVATQQAATPEKMADRRFQDDVRTLLDWFQVGEFEQPLAERLAMWNALPLAEQARHHEAFAYNFELYLHEGKAPSIELKGVFARFRAWLTRLYKSIRDELNVLYRREFGEDLPILTGEVRGIFDRMLASEQAITEAEAVRSMGAVFQSRDEFIAAGNKPEEWDELQAAHELAHEEAVLDLTRRSIKATRWTEDALAEERHRLSSQERAARKAVRGEVSKEVAARPVYRAIRWLRKGEVVDAEGKASKVEGPHRIDTAAVRDFVAGPLEAEARAAGAEGGEAFAQAQMAKLHGMLSEGGLAPDDAAGRLGLGTGEAMIRALLAAPPLKEAVEAETALRMGREHGDLVDPGMVQAAVERAVHHEARARYVAMTLRFAGNVKQPQRVVLAAAREVALQRLGAMPLREIVPHTFAMAEGRAAKQAQEAMAKGDADATAVALRHQLIQNQMVVAAMDVVEERDKALRDFRKVFRSNEKLADHRDVDLVNAARAMLGVHGIGTPIQQEAAKEYLAKVQAYDPELFAELDGLLRDSALQAHGRTYKDLSLDQFRVLRDGVEALWFRAGREREIEVGGKKVALTEIAKQLRARLLALGLRDPMKRDPTAADEWQRDLLQAVATNTRIEHLLDYLGPEFTRYVWRPISNALNGYRAARAKWTARYEKLLQQHRKAGNMQPGAIEAPELGHTFTSKATLIGALYHIGNDSNMGKNLLSRGWAELQDDGTVDTSKWDGFFRRMVETGRITKADLDFVQSVWDLNADMLPLLQEAHRELRGHYFKEVKPKAFTVTFRDGTTKTYRGGYVPASAEKFEVQSARLQEQLAELEGDFRQTVPSVLDGMTKERNESVRRKLSHDPGQMAGHIDAVLKFVYLAAPVRDAFRVLTHKEFAPTLEAFNPVLMEKALLPWLQRVARQYVTEPGKNRRWDRILTTLRANTGLATMFLNYANALMNYVGVVTARVLVPGKYLRNAAVRMPFQSKKIAAEVSGKSEFMADRLGSQIFDLYDNIRDVARNAGAWTKLNQWGRKHGYIAQKFTQNHVDLIVWTAAYNHALVEQGAKVPADVAEREAVMRADAAVRRTQYSTNPEDVSAFEVGTPLWRAWTQFVGWFNGWANLNVFEARKAVRDLGWTRGAPRLAEIYLFGILLTTTLSDAIARILAGQTGDDDEDGMADEWVEWLLASQARAALTAIPVVGQAATLAWNVIDDKPWNDRMPVAPVFSVAERGAKGIVGLFRDEATGTEIRDAATLLTVLTGFPFAVPARTGGYLRDVDRGEIRPTGAVDAIRGAITGRASEESRK